MLFNLNFHYDLSIRQMFLETVTMEFEERTFLETFFYMRPREMTVLKNYF